MKYILLPLIIALSGCLQPDAATPTTLTTTDTQPSTTTPISTPTASQPVVTLTTPQTVAEHTAAFAGVFTSQQDPRNTVSVSGSTVVLHGYASKMQVMIRYPDLSYTMDGDYECYSTHTITNVLHLYDTDVKYFSLTINIDWSKPYSGQSFRNTGWLIGCDNPVDNRTPNMFPVHWISDKCFETLDEQSLDGNFTGTFCKQ